LFLVKPVLKKTGFFFYTSGAVRPDDYRDSGRRLVLKVLYISVKDFFVLQINNYL